MLNKALRRVEFKDADAGYGGVEAVFATLNTKDHDGDVTLPGAFEPGAPVRISAYNHQSWGGALPIGKGTIREVGNEVVFTGEFFDTQAAQDTRKALQGLGDLAEWSYGFDIKDSEPGEHQGEKVRFLKSMKVHEVSPVLIGAGIGTRTLAVKSREDMRFSEHGEAVLADLAKFRARAAEVVAMRAEKGRGLGEDSEQLVQNILKELKALESVLTAPTPQSEDVTAEMLRIWRRTVANYETEA